MTNREFVSQIWTDLRIKDIDSYLPPKSILIKGQKILGDYIKKTSDQKRIYRVSEGWTELECIPMVEVPVTECGELDTKLCTTLRRTEYKLPDTYSTNFGNLIRQVASINFGIFYEPKSPREWKAIQKRKDKDLSKKYYFFINGYIYIPNSDVESIRVEAYFKDKFQINKINTANCTSCKKDCPRLLDFDFVSPEYLLNDVLKGVIQEYASIYSKIIPDELPNQNQIEKNDQKV